jgi:hypothetical protein
MLPTLLSATRGGSLEYYRAVRLSTEVALTAIRAATVPGKAEELVDGVAWCSKHCTGDAVIVEPRR